MRVIIPPHVILHQAASTHAGPLHFRTVHDRPRLLTLTVINLFQPTHPHQPTPHQAMPSHTSPRHINPQATFHARPHAPRPIQTSPHRATAAMPATVSARRPTSAHPGHGSPHQRTPGRRAHTGPLPATARVTPTTDHANPQQSTLGDDSLLEPTPVEHIFWFAPK